MSILDILGLGADALQIGGTAYSAAAKRRAGQDAANLAEYNAQLYEQSANSAKAASQRQAYNEQRHGKYVKSATQARAAASGAMGPDITNIMAGLDAETHYRVLSALYGGEDKARNYVMNAAATRLSGQTAKRNAETASFNTLLTGFGKTLFDKYGAFNRPSSSDPFGSGDTSKSSKSSWDDYSLDVT